MMGDQIINPRKAQTTDPSSSTSDTEKRSFEDLERRREMWERKLEARVHLEERGLFDWFDGLFDSSANCYVKGYPSLGGKCASTASPYIRSPVPTIPTDIPLSHYTKCSLRCDLYFELD